MAKRTTTAWHYTTLETAQDYFEQGFIPPAFLSRSQGFPSVVLFSTNQEWDSFTFAQMDGRNARPGIKELRGSNSAFARIGVPVGIIPFDWRSLKQRARIPKPLESAIEDAAKRAGFSIACWHGYLSPVPMQHWRAIDIWMSGKWERVFPFTNTKRLDVVETAGPVVTEEVDVQPGETRLPHEATEQESPPGPLNVRYYAAALLDILGQGNALAGLRRIELGPVERSSLLESARESIGAVLQTRDDLTSWLGNLATIEARRDSRSHYLLWKPATREKYLRILKPQIKAQVFSDTVLLFVPLADEDGTLLVPSLFSLIGACSSVLLTSLIRGTPVRGAIEVGIGVELKDRDFYGPVLQDVHRMEKDEAEYPRVLVGPQAMDFLHHMRHYRGLDRIGQFQGSMAEVCLSLIRNDPDDGRPFVDFLNGLFGASHGPDDPYNSGIDMATEYVASQLRRFTEAGDEKHVRRYSRLKRYFDSFGSK